MKQTPKGFTLIELVVVIVILGILAVVAAPKFLNLQHDAREAVIKGLGGSVHNAAEMAFGKTAVEGMEHEESYSIEGYGSVQYGYPAVQRGGMENFLDIESGYHDLTKEWVWGAHNHGSVSNPDTWIVTRSEYIDAAPGEESAYNKTIEDTQCYVKYTAAMEPGAEYKVEVFTDGC